MKTLYESILSSTKSGRFSKLTEEYLESLGYYTKSNIISKAGSPFYIHRNKGRFYVKIQRLFSDSGKDIIETIKYYVDTIHEFEMVMAYWKAHSEGNLKEIEKTYKTLKEKLKRF